MRVSGFTIVRDGVRFGYPFIESIRSILPIVDEFVCLVGDSQDTTLEAIQAIDSDKLVIRESVWDPAMREGGRVMSYQTNLALQECSGDWCFYLQADEVVHEEDLPAILAAMQRYANVPSVDGLSFRYRHFVADYSIQNPLAYRKQTRIVRNHSGIESVGDACGFAKVGTKLRTQPTGAWMYHYGWVRPPTVMVEKWDQFSKFYSESTEKDPRTAPQGADLAELSDDELAAVREFEFNLAACQPYRGSHPKIMQERIEAKDWETPPFAYVPKWRNAAWWDRFCRKNFSSLYKWGHRKSA